MNLAPITRPELGRTTSKGYIIGPYFRLLSTLDLTSLQGRSLWVVGSHG
jgi:hypothetical protein